MRLFYLLIFLFPGLSFAQKIDNTVSFRDLNTDAYFRFNYDNDFFSANDYYYTQGYSFEMASPVFAKNPLSTLLISLKDSTALHGLAFEHYGFTPTSIRSDEILIGDRPFAACIMLKSFKVSKNKKGDRLASVLSVGMIGPAAFGGSMQKTIHKWIGGVEPHGWQHQIKNDVILNYELNHEKIFYTNRFLALNSNANFRAGTLSTKIQTGLTLVIGRHNSFINAQRKKYQFYIYNQPLVNVIAYDATLQGTLFNKSPYTLKASDINRFNLQNNFGAVIKLNKLYLEYNQVVLGKEFKTGKYHRWGGFKVGFFL